MISKLLLPVPNGLPRAWDSCRELSSYKRHGRGDSQLRYFVCWVFKQQRSKRNVLFVAQSGVLLAVCSYCLHLCLIVCVFRARLLPLGREWGYVWYLWCRCMCAALVQSCRTWLAWSFCCCSTILERQLICSGSSSALIRTQFKLRCNCLGCMLWKVAISLWLLLSYITAEKYFLS